MARRVRDYKLKLRLINLPKEERNVSPGSTASSLMVPTPPPQLRLPLGFLNFGKTSGFCAQANDRSQDLCGIRNARYINKFSKSKS